MNKWEYKVVDLMEDRFTFLDGYDCDCRTREEFSSAEHRHHKIISKTIDELGAEGWELVSVHNGDAYFKRAMPE
jgi:hypothetical protein